MTNGLVTTIIPAYNRATMVGEAVASVLEQTYRPIEIIIVDDGSSDETADVCDSFAQGYPREIRVLHQPNSGPGLAREAGRRLAQGEFIQYLDSDDLLLPSKFELQVSGLELNPQCGVSYGKTRYMYANGAVEPEAWKGSGTRVKHMFPSFLVSRWWDTPTPLYRRSVCDEAGPWTSLRLEEDWEYDCRIASLGAELHYCDEFVAVVRDHPDGRLCQGEALDPNRLLERARSHKLIREHARRAGIPDDAAEMRHFARELFLLARQCGAAGLARESKELFVLAKKASGDVRGKQWDFRVYECLARVVGWKHLGKLACYSDNFRR